ncbi:Uncharacterised protein [Streptococcus pneumoniae]|nr:Uncharacterised protein [Streptococcus pneumoniae]
MTFSNPLLSALYRFVIGVFVPSFTVANNKYGLIPSAPNPYSVTMSCKERRAPERITREQLRRNLFSLNA